MLNPTNQNKVGVLLPNPNNPKFATEFASGNRELFSLRTHASGITGTPDPKLDIDNAFEFLGAFRIPWVTSGGDQGSTRDASSIAVNTQSNTIFIGKNNYQFPFGSYLFEFAIPSLVKSSNYADLNNASIVNDNLGVQFDSFLSDHPSATYTSDRIGAMKVIGGDLYISHYKTYLANGSFNYNALSICRDISNISNSSSWQGYISTSAGDLGVGYMFDIPAEHQSLFSGHSHGLGVGNPPSIASRFSFGNSFYGWNPAAIGASDTSVSTTQFVYYSQNNRIQGFSDFNANITNHYGSLVLPSGATWPIYLAQDPATRVNDLSGYPVPDKDLYRITMTLESGAEGAFIIPGTDTLVFIGSVKGSEYGLTYKSKTLQGKNFGSDVVPLDGNDVRDAVWLLNLNDVTNAANSHDPQYYDFFEFQGSQFKQDGGKLVSADFDPQTGLLYVLYAGLPFNSFNRSHVVSVFQVTTGVL
jgi:hypothetical protein